MSQSAAYAAGLTTGLLVALAVAVIGIVMQVHAYRVGVACGRHRSRPRQPRNETSRRTCGAKP